MADDDATKILHDASRMSAFRMLYDAAIARALSSARVGPAYREATWGDPGFQIRDRNVDGYGKAETINWEHSQLVMVKPRYVIYRIVDRPGQSRLSRDQLQVVHAGNYYGDETEAPLIAAEVLQAHLHEETIMPVSRRVDVIQLQMPDGAFRVFRRDGPTALVEKKVPQAKESLIVRGLRPVAGG